MSRTIVFVLGAGFSEPFGIPTMKPFLQSFRDTALRKYPELESTLKKHFDRLSDESDIEALLTSLNSAEGLQGSLPPGADIGAELASWQNDSRILKAHLVSYIIDRCERFDQEESVRVLAPLLKSTVDATRSGTICFATTNYDRVIEYVCSVEGVKFSDGFGGHEEAVSAAWTGAFEERVHLYKLHGSVTYYGERESSARESCFRLDRGYPLPGPDFRLTLEGSALEPLMVLPTLEKETLDDPYGQLNHRFVEMMSRSQVVVAIGTSLRDKDLVSALNYNSEERVVLLVDVEPSVARERINGIRCVTLKANARDFLVVSTDRLVELLDSCAREEHRDSVLRMVEDFAKNELGTIAQWASMNTEQRDALDILQTSSAESRKVEALRVLRGVGDPGVVEAVSRLCVSSGSPTIRKAAAGCLGLSGSSQAVGALREHTLNDPLPDVRLEGYLALRELGFEEGLVALDAARGQWPNDSYFD